MVTATAAVDRAVLPTRRVLPQHTPPDQVLDLGRPPRKPLVSLALLLLVLLICLPPLLVRLGERDSTHTMEQIALLSSQDTWLRQRGYLDVERDPNAWLMPTRNGSPRVTKPPLLVWLNLLAWSNLAPEAASVDTLTYRARLVSVGMALLLVASVFWAGLTLGDRKLAFLSALVAGTMLVLQRQAHTASYDIHFAAWAALAVAATLWAMRPFAAAPAVRRAFVGYLIAGVALGAAWMTKGPLALVVTLVPLIAIIAVVRNRWRRNLLGLMGVALLAAALVAPWYIYALNHFAQAKDVWAREFLAERDEFQPPWYYLALVALVAPWCVWLIAGVVMPFAGFTGRVRRRLLIPWLWFAGIFVVFSIPGAKQQRYILPILPAAALLIGQVWWYHHHLALRHEKEPRVDLLRLPHWVALISVSVLIGPFMLAQPWLVEQGWLEEQPLGPISTGVVAVFWPMLLALSTAGALVHYHWKPLSAGVISGLWAAAFLTLIWAGYANAPAGRHPIRPEAERINAIVGSAPLHYLRIPTSDGLLNEEFLLYAKRIAPTLVPRDLQNFTAKLTQPTYLVARDAEPHTRALAAAGWTAVEAGEFMQDKDLPSRLWKYEPAEPRRKSALPEMSQQ